MSFFECHDLYSAASVAFQIDKTSVCLEFQGRTF